MDEICAQLTSATILPRIYVEQASQFVQQTNTTARQALKRMTTVQAQTQELCTKVKGALHQQAATVDMQAEQETQRLHTEVEFVLHEQLSAAKEETAQKLGIIMQELMQCL